MTHNKDTNYDSIFCYTSNTFSENCLHIIRQFYVTRENVCVWVRFVKIFTNSFMFYFDLYLFFNYLITDFVLNIN